MENIQHRMLKSSKVQMLFGCSALDVGCSWRCMGSRHGFLVARWAHEPIVTQSCYTCNMDLVQLAAPGKARGRPDARYKFQIQFRLDLRLHRFCRLLGWFAVQ